MEYKMTWYIVTKPKRTLAILFGEVVLKKPRIYDADLIIKHAGEKDYEVIIAPIIEQLSKEKKQAFPLYIDVDEGGYSMKDVIQMFYLDIRCLNAGERECLFRKVKNNDIVILDDDKAYSCERKSEDGPSCG